MKKIPENYQLKPSDYELVWRYNGNDWIASSFNQWEEDSPMEYILRQRMVPDSDGKSEWYEDGDRELFHDDKPGVWPTLDEAKAAIQLREKEDMQSCLEAGDLEMSEDE